VGCFSNVFGNEQNNNLRENKQMNANQIQGEVQVATDTWWTGGEDFKGSLPENPIKVYKYGQCWGGVQDVVLYNYSDCVIVGYAPTGSWRKFKNKAEGFAYAKDRGTHCGAINKLLA